MNESINKIMHHHTIYNLVNNDQKVYKGIVTEVMLNRAVWTPVYGSV